MPYTPEEQAAATAKAIENAKAWLDVANIIATGGDPETADLVEAGRVLQQHEDDATEFIRQYIRDLIS